MEEALSFRDKGNELFRKGEYEEASYLYLRALNGSRSDVSLHRSIVTNLATSLYILGKYGEALDILRTTNNEILGFAKENVKGLYRMVQCYNALCNWSFAVYYGKIGLKFEPEHDGIKRELEIAYQFCDVPEEKVDKGKKDFLKNLRLSKEVKKFIQETSHNETYFIKVKTFIKFTSVKDLFVNFEKVEKILEIWKYKNVGRELVLPLLKEMSSDAILTIKMIEKTGINYILSDYLESCLNKNDELLELFLQVLATYAEHSNEFISHSFGSLMIENMIKIIIKPYKSSIKSYAINFLSNCVEFSKNRDLVCRSPNLNDFTKILIEFLQSNPSCFSTIGLLCKLLVKKVPLCLENAIWDLSRHPDIKIRIYSSRAIHLWISGKNIINHSRMKFCGVYENIKNLSIEETINMCAKKKSEIISYVEKSSKSHKLLNVLLNDLKNEKVTLQDSYVKFGLGYVNILKSTQHTDMGTIKTIDKSKLPFENMLDVLQKSSYHLEKAGYDCEYRIIQSKVFIYQGDIEKLLKLAKSSMKKYPKELYFMYSLIIGTLQNPIKTRGDLLDCLELLNKKKDAIDSNEYIPLCLLSRSADIILALFLEYPSVFDKKYLQDGIDFLDLFFKNTPDDREGIHTVYSYLVFFKYLLFGPKFTMEDFQISFSKIKDYEYWNEKVWKDETLFASTLMLELMSKKIVLLKKADKFYQENPISINYMEESEVQKNEELRIGIKECKYCHIKSTQLNRCAGCKKVFYCNEKCQSNNWKIHKKDCRIDKE